MIYSLFTVGGGVCQLKQRPGTSTRRHHRVEVRGAAGLLAHGAGRTARPDGRPYPQLAGWRGGLAARLTVYRPGVREGARSWEKQVWAVGQWPAGRERSEEHTSELQSR